LSDPERRAALLRVVLDRAGPVTPPHQDWSEWLWVAQLDRVAPLLYRLVDQIPTELDETDRTQIRQLQGAVMCRCVQLEHHLIAVTGLLAAQGIGSVVLKGGATCHLDYPDPSWREFSDIDLLIDPADLIRATAVVESAGWMQGYALPGGHARYTHAITFVRDGMELDLHQRIAHRAIGVLVPTAELMRRGVPFQVAGAELRALDDVDRLIHAALHAVTSRGPTSRLSSLADVLLLMNRRPELAADTVARAEGWRVRSLLERGLHLAYGEAELDVPRTWREAMSLPVRRRDRLVDRAYLSAARRPVIEELAYLRLMDRWADRFGYVGGYFATDRKYVDQHGRSGPLAQARYVMAKLRARE
jgi:hypothetical protein